MDRSRYPSREHLRSDREHSFLPLDRSCSFPRLTSFPFREVRESIEKKLDVFEQSSACSRFSSWPKSRDTLGWLERQTNFDSSINTQRAIAFRSESLFYRRPKSSLCRRTKSTLSAVHADQWTGNRDNKIENEPCLTLILIDCFVWLSARRIHTIFTPWNVRSM